MQQTKWSEWESQRMQTKDRQSDRESKRGREKGVKCFHVHSMNAWWMHCRRIEWNLFYFIFRCFCNSVADEVHFSFDRNRWRLSFHYFFSFCFVSTSISSQHATTVAMHDAQRDGWWPNVKFTHHFTSLQCIFSSFPFRLTLYLFGCVAFKMHCWALRIARCACWQNILI